MWNTIEFKTHAEMLDFMFRKQHIYQMVEVFINNSYGLDYKPLTIIDIK